MSYCWAEIPGYSKIGRYRGKGGSGTSGDSKGPFIYCGFEPAWVMIKDVDTSGRSWIIQDNKRDPSNPTDRWLFADGSSDGSHSDGRYIDLLSDGFKIRSARNETNQNDINYMYLAFAEATIPSQFGVTPTGRARNGSA